VQGKGLLVQGKVALISEFCVVGAREAREAREESKPRCRKALKSIEISEDEAMAGYSVVREGMESLHPTDKGRQDRTVRESPVLYVLWSLTFPFVLSL
jgi:hypothetical protein